jgi:uncharacterized protein YceK
MRRLLIVLFVCLLLAGCKVDTTVTVAVHDDGSGFVRINVALDAEAVQNAETGGGKLEDRVRLGDLDAAGWKVSPWKRAQDGSATLALRKDFTAADDVSGIFEELNGKDGPLRGVTLERDHNVLFTRYKLSGVADLSQLTAGVTADPELAAQLSGQRVDLTQIDQQLNQEIRDAFRLRIRLDLPGGSKAFTPEPGKRVYLSTSTTELDTTRALLLLAAVVLGMLGIVLLVRGELRSRRRRRRRRDLA